MSSDLDEYEASILARHFQSLPHGKLRYASLTNLAASLTPWDARHLRLQLQHSKGLARLEDLPLELILMLVPHLALEDVNSCFTVSRTWRRVWTEPLIIAELWRHFFPIAPHPHSLSAFQRESRRRRHRKFGNFKYKLEKELEFETETYFQLDPEFHPTPDYPRLTHTTTDAVFVSYSDGKLVWRIGMGCLVIDDFHTRKRRVLELNRDRQLLDIDGRGAFTGRAFSSRSLLAFFIKWPGQRCLFILHWKTSNWARYTLPSNPISWRVVGETILISLPGPTVCVLKYDGFLIETLVETHPPHGFTSPGHLVFHSAHSQYAIIPDPLSETTVFLMDPGLVDLPVSEGPEDGIDTVQRRVILLHEACPSGHVATYDFDVTGVRVAGVEREYGPTFASLCYETYQRDAGPDDRTTLDFHRKGPIDDYGLYIVCLIPIPARAVCMAGLPGPVHDDCGYMIAVTFDTVRREFGTRTYPYTFSMGSFIPVPLGLWGEQMFVRDPERGGGQAQFEVKIVEPIGSHSAWSAVTPYRAEFPTSEDSLDMHPLASDDMRQDKDFMLVMNGNRYILWSFEEGNGEDDAGSCELSEAG